MTIHLPLAIELIFRHPSRLWWALTFVVVLLVVFLEAWARARALRNPGIELHLSTSRLPTFFERLRWWMGWIVATSLLLMAYANPERVLYDWVPVFERIRITFIADVSLSMKKAEDILPNRLEAQKNVIRDFTGMLEQDPELKGKYSLALIPFSGAALPYYLPFTTSRDEFLSHLEAMDTDTVTRKGTSLWAAFRAYDALLLANPRRDKNTLDLAILISDGGKEEGKKERALIPSTIVDLLDPHRALHLTFGGEQIIVRSKDTQRRVILNTVGVGRVDIIDDVVGGRKVGEKRVPYSTPLVNRDRSGNFTGYDHVKENDIGSPVETSTLDEKILDEVAARSGGGYRHFSDRETILREFKALVLANRSEVDRIPISRYESARAWLLAPAFILYYFLFGYSRWLVYIYSQTISWVRIIRP